MESRDLGDGRMQTDIAVPEARCGGCIAAIEGALLGLPGVSSARVNLTARKVVVKWHAEGDVPAMIQALRKAGYRATLAEALDATEDPEMSRLLRATAVAGFAAMNIMLLSVSIWSGADPATRHAFHLVSAALALPALVYSGSLFFASAWRVLRAGRTNMDVPISVGILLAFGLSTYDSLSGGQHAYFDAVTSLLFFLLAGRAIDHSMRGRARHAVQTLARMFPRVAAIVLPDGSREYRDTQTLTKGDTIFVAAGERIPADGTVLRGAGLLDLSLVTGETSPESVSAGSKVVSGAMSVNAPLTVRLDRAAKDSFLADMIRLMESIEGGRARYRRLADRAASFYSPVIHVVALATFAGWFYATGDWHLSLTLAIAVLIITCPCALGLAVPMVQAVAARRLFASGITMKDGSALERLAEVDHVVLDKTGTLTSGRMQVSSHDVSGADLFAASALAGHSRHPAAHAVATLRPDAVVPVSDVLETSGQGIEGWIDGRLYKLGRRTWVADARDGQHEVGPWLSRDGVLVGRFVVSDRLREGAAGAVVQLTESGLGVEILSGDASAETLRIASLVHVPVAAGELRPEEKVTRLEALRARGKRVLMVGDGINDAPALAAAHVSMAPSTATDVGRHTADLVFLGSSLLSVPEAISVSVKAMRLIRQNIALSIAYNALALPLAVAGYVTPLVAAVAMSTSSILVVVNSLRLSNSPKIARSEAADALRPVTA